MMRDVRFYLTALLVLYPLKLVSQPFPAPTSSFNRAAWFEDYAQLRDAVGTSYANFLDKVHLGEVEPFRLNAVIQQKLAAAQNDREAFRAILHFIGAFKDGHFQVSNLKDAVQKYAPFRIVYPVQFALAHDRPVVSSISEPGCGIPAESEVVALNNVPIETAIAFSSEIIGVGNSVLRRHRALETLAAGGFAPEERLIVEANVRGKLVRCELKPRSEPWPGASNVEEGRTELTAATPGFQACQQMGYSDRGSGLNFQFDQVPGFRHIWNQSYSAGIIKEPDFPSIGFMRIHSFGELSYFSTCSDEWDRFRSSLVAACDDACQQSFQAQRMIPRLIADAESLILEFNRLKVGHLVVDITGNGGGGDWADVMARMISPKASLTCPIVRLMRRPSTVARYELILSMVKLDLAHPSLSLEERMALNTAQEELVQLVNESRKNCDLQEIWNRPEFDPTCQSLTESGEHACGILSYLPQGSLAQASSRQALFKALEYTYRESLFQGKLTVVVDRRTASAAEYFASFLRDSHAASLVGEKTFAVGCGYINGRDPMRLKHSGIEVIMPNCARFRASGRNEVFGVEPDRNIPWVGESPVEATGKLLDIVRKK